jgi:hypothetical protein
MMRGRCSLMRKCARLPQAASFHHTMQIQEVQMTPQRAAQILQCNTRNRAMNLSRVDFYADAMLKGNWMQSGEPIQIDSDGCLINGQHRLQAIVNSGMTVPVLLITGQDPSVFAVLDTGRARSASDVLSIGGAKNCTRAAAGIKLYFLYVDHPNKVWTGAKLARSHQEILNYYRAKPKFTEFWSKEAVNTYSANKLLNPSALLAFAFVARDAETTSSEQVSQFFELIAHGYGLQEGCPIHRYRQMLANQQASGSFKRASSINQMALASLIKVFNYWANGVSMKLFKTPNYPPMPVIDI